MATQLFLIILTYKKELTEIDALMKEHVVYLKKYYKLNKFIVSGRQIPRRGGVIICNAEDLTEVKAIIKEDPFILAKAATQKIIAFNASMYSGTFKSVLEKL